MNLRTIGTAILVASVLTSAPALAERKVARDLSLNDGDESVRVIVQYREGSVRGELGVISGRVLHVNSRQLAALEQDPDVVARPSGPRRVGHQFQRHPGL